MGMVNPNLGMAKRIRDQLIDRRGDRLWVSEIEVRRDNRQTTIACPGPSRCRERHRREQVYVDGPDSASDESAVVQERERLVMRGGRRRWQPRQEIENFAPVTQIPHASSPITNGCTGTRPR